MATNSMVSEGCIISGGGLSHCVLSPKVRINSYAQVTDSILMENVNVGRYAEIRKAIIDKNVDIPPYTKIGVNKEDDIARGFYVSEGGVTPASNAPNSAAFFKNSTSLNNLCSKYCNEYNSGFLM